MILTKNDKIILMLIVTFLFSLQLSYGTSYDSLIHSKWKFVGYEHGDSINHCPSYVSYTLEFGDNNTVKGNVVRNYNGKYKIRKERIKIKKIFIPKSSDKKLSNIDEIQMEFAWRLWFMRDLPTTSYKKFSIRGNFLKIVLSDKTIMLFESMKDDHENK